ncbi:MAG: FeoB-associated Cys-rich membrane protein [Bacteroidales bacterium]|nr:FeoB-associated Cys-rich membrane protein [Bacteroidales bacterium]
MDAQTWIVAAVVTATVVLAARWVVRTARGRGGCGCGCKDCPHAGGKHRCTRGDRKPRE